jgi:PKD repeat protein
VGFTNTSTGSISGYFWNFDDGSTSTATNPVHDFGSDPFYNVHLTATGPGGSDGFTLQLVQCP